MGKSERLNIFLTAQQAIMSLTKGSLNVVSEPDRPARETDAEDAIEITDAMIDAGVMAFYETDFRVESAEEAVLHIFVSMMRAKETGSKDY